MWIRETELLISVQLLKYIRSFSFEAIWVPAMSSKKRFKAKSAAFMNAIRPETLLCSFTWRRQAGEHYQEAIYSSLILWAPGWVAAAHSCIAPWHPPPSCLRYVIKGWGDNWVQRQTASHTEGCSDGQVQAGCRSFHLHARGKGGEGGLNEFGVSG